MTARVSLGGVVILVDIDNVKDEKEFYKKLCNIDGFKELEGPYASGIYAITFEIEIYSNIPSLIKKVEKCCTTRINLSDKILSALEKESPQSIPSLCKKLQHKDAFEIQTAIAELEHIGKVYLVDFEKIYREDGGAIYLAKYALKISKELNPI